MSDNGAPIVGIGAEPRHGRCTPQELHGRRVVLETTHEFGALEVEVAFDIRQRGKTYYARQMLPRRRTFRRPPCRRALAFSWSATRTGATDRASALASARTLAALWPIRVVHVPERGKVQHARPREGQLASGPGSGLAVSALLPFKP